LGISKLGETGDYTPVILVVLAAAVLTLVA